MADILFAIINKVSAKGRCYLFLDAGGSKEMEALKSCYMLANRAIYKEIVILATTSGGMWEYPKEVKKLFSLLSRELKPVEIKGGVPPRPRKKNSGLLTQKPLAASNGELYTAM